MGEYFPFFYSFFPPLFFNKMKEIDFFHSQKVGSSHKGRIASRIYSYRAWSTIPSLLKGKAAFEQFQEKAIMIPEYVVTSHQLPVKTSEWQQSRGRICTLLRVFLALNEGGTCFFSSDVGCLGRFCWCRAQFIRKSESMKGDILGKLIGQCSFCMHVGIEAGFLD